MCTTMNTPEAVIIEHNNDIIGLFSGKSPFKFRVESSSLISYLYYQYIQISVEYTSFK